MAQDLLGEEDIKVTARNKTQLEQSVIGLRGKKVARYAARGEDGM